MSFLKITDPAKRDFIVEDFLKSKRNIQQNTISEKLGDISLQRELTKFYKPITESQSGLSSQLKEIKEGTTAALKELPSSIATQLKSITFPQYPSIEAYEEPEESDSTLNLGETATKYLKQYTTNRKNTDTIFGIHSKKDGNFYIGTEPITIEGDNITVKGKNYTGTPGLWELITMARPNDSIYDQDDLDNYYEILDDTNAIRNESNPNKPKSSRSEKYRVLIKPLWESIKIKKGSGITIILPSDPNALVEMLSIRLAAAKAGNTGAANEAVAISDELLRQEVLNNDEYKSITKQISKFI